MAQAAIESQRVATEPTRHGDIEKMEPAESKAWYESEVLELENHKKNGTFRAVVPITELEKGTSVLRTTWAYKGKIGPDGKVIKRKSRLSTCGGASSFGNSRRTFSRP